MWPCSLSLLIHKLNAFGPTGSYLTRTQSPDSGSGILSPPFEVRVQPPKGSLLKHLLFNVLTFDSPDVINYCMFAFYLLLITSDLQVVLYTRAKFLEESSGPMDRNWTIMLGPISALTDAPFRRNSVHSSAVPCTLSVTFTHCTHATDVLTLWTPRPSTQLQARP